MYKHMIVAVLSGCFIGVADTPRCLAGDPENPFKKVEVGDWAIYKGSRTTPSGKTSGTEKWTVSSKDEKQVSIKKTYTPDPGFAIPEMKIDLTKPYDPTEGWLAGLVADDVKREEADAKETITVGKTKYECRVVTVTRIYKVGRGNKVESKEEFKVWTCPDAPLSGVVKIQRKFWGTVGVADEAEQILDDTGKAK